MIGHADINQLQFLRVPPSQSPAHDDISSSPNQKKKVPKQGPFYFFMMDKKREWMSEGKWNENYGMRRLVDECMPLWKLMKTNPILMEPYIEKAREQKNRQRGDLSAVYDSHGRSLADIRLEANRVRERFETMNRDIEDTVSGAGASVVNKTFYVAHFNYLCITDQDFYIPCEAAVVKFSVKEGVLETWHDFISPLDSIPIGYKYRCIKHARNTHFLTPDFERYNTDMKDVLGSLVEFLGGDEEELPPLYAAPDHLAAADCVTSFLVNRAGSSLRLRVYSLPKLLQELAPLPSIYVAEAWLEHGDKHAHVSGLGCALHSSLRAAAHCSLSISQRMVFSVAHCCCQAYKIQPRPGQHFPLERLVNPLNPSQIRFENLAIEERINRMIPNPGGVTDIPQGLDEELSRKLNIGQVDSDDTQGRRNKDSRSLGQIFGGSFGNQALDEWYSKDEEKGCVPECGVGGRSLGAIPKKFPAKDVREKSSKEAPIKITTVKPTLVKSGRSIVIHK